MFLGYLLIEATPWGPPKIKLNKFFNFLTEERHE